MVCHENVMERLVTHTYTSDRGVVVVVTDVPAIVYDDKQGTRETRYKAPSSRVITSYVKHILKAFSEPGVHSTTFEEAKGGVNMSAFTDQLKDQALEFARDLLLEQGQELVSGYVGALLNGREPTMEQRLAYQEAKQNLGGGRNES